MIDAEQVLAEVAAAFPAEPLPAKERLLNTHCCECVEVSEAYGYKPWPAITLDDLRAGGETALLTPVAWRYYLPAVMTWCIRAPEAVDVIQDNLVYQLAPREPGEEEALYAWFEERSGGFAEAQRHAVAGFLRWYKERLESEYHALRLEPPKHVDRALAYWTTRGTPRRAG